LSVSLGLSHSVDNSVLTVYAAKANSSAQKSTYMPWMSFQECPFWRTKIKLVIAQTLPMKDLNKLNLTDIGYGGLVLGSCQLLATASAA